MSNSFDAIKRVVEAFERSEWAEIDVRAGDLRVHLSASAPSSPAPTAPDSTSPDPPERSTTASASPPPNGAHVVVAPCPGIFWRSPEPGLPPFADVGHTMDASATVCIVEVMKLMNHVKAGIGGEVLAVYVHNGEAVQKGQPLFAIAVSGSST